MMFGYPAKVVFKDYGSMHLTTPLLAGVAAIKFAAGVDPRARR
jgi:hypothetical protein